MRKWGIKRRETGPYFAIYSLLATATTIKISLFISIRITYLFFTTRPYLNTSEKIMHHFLKVLNQTVKLYIREMDTAAKWVSSGTTDYLSTPKREKHSSYVANKTKE